MKALDIGCGSEPELWFSGADLCDHVLDPNDYKATEIEGRVLYLQEINIQTPQILSDPGVYDFIWCSSAWDWMDDNVKHAIEAEMFRLLKKGGRAIIRELTLVEDIPDIQTFLKEQLAFFPRERWYGYPYYNVDVQPETMEIQAYLYLYLFYLKKL